MIGSTALVNKN